MTHNKKQYLLNWFTLVELIVVIVILAILATIAFLSFNSYSSSARNSTRLSDINGVRKSIELYHMNSWKYPVPSSPTHTVTYSWWLLFTEWTLWDSVFKILSNMSKKTIDPKVWVEYTYSVSNSNREYLIWTMSEWNSSSYIPANNLWDLFSDKVLAANSSATAIVSGNYNWVLSPLVNTGSMYYYMALPTIITSDTRTGNLEITAISTWAFVYDDMWNLPFTYQWWNSSSTWTFTFNPQVVYSWASAPKTSADVSTLVTNLKSSYSWSAIQSSETISKVVNWTVQDVVNQTVPLINANWWATLNVASIDPYAANNILLLHFDWNLGNSWSNIWTVTNNWWVTLTSAWKFWNSAWFSWTGLLSLANSTDWNFWAWDFTVDFWYKLSSNAGGTFLAKQTAWTYEWFAIWYGSNLLRFDVSTTWSSWNMRLSKDVWYDTNWHHVSAVRNWNIYFLFQDGVLLASSSSVSWNFINSASSLRIWANSNLSQPISWFLDEIRVTKWVARWTTDFIPPTISY